jgi:hypothetical protein
MTSNQGFSPSHHYSLINEPDTCTIPIRSGAFDILLQHIHYNIFIRIFMSNPYFESIYPLSVFVPDVIPNEVNLNDLLSTKRLLQAFTCPLMYTQQQLLLSNNQKLNTYYNAFNLHLVDNVLFSEAYPNYLYQINSSQQIGKCMFYFLKNIG